jgi:hypothetical protein
MLVTSTKFNQTSMADPLGVLSGVPIAASTIIELPHWNLQFLESYKTDEVEHHISVD